MSQPGDRVNVRLGAVTTIIKLYGNEPAFKKEFREICQAHTASVLHFILCWIERHREAILLPEHECQKMLANLEKNHNQHNEPLPF